MKKLFLDALKLSPIFVAAAFASANSAFANEINGSVTPVSQLSQQTQQSDNMGQVTSVSQFSDVQPTDWAFQALQSLVERYGCIAGYPNGTFRGNRAMTRYEFAAGLNACLDRVNELIATATADLVKKEDLATLQRLQEEFSAELATLRGRVDALEARTAELEANQFSTTTKLQGEAIFSLSSPFGERRADTDNIPNNSAEINENIVFANRARLSFNSSFTGKDRLQVRINANNNVNNQSVTGTNMTRLTYDGDTNNAAFIDKVNYRFNLSDAIQVQIDANNGELYNNMNSFNPLFISESQGTLSRYGRVSPIYRQAQGGAGITVNVNPNGPISFSAGYMAAQNVANNPNPGNGLFNGSSSIIGQIGFNPSKQIGIGLTYARTYRSDSNNLFQGTGSSFANAPFGTDPATSVSSNNYGVQAVFSPSKNISLNGWFGYTDAKAESGVNRGREADAIYWMAQLGLKDFGGEGNLLGIFFGQPPKITSVSSGITRTDTDTSYHLEALYRYRLNDNISVTPGVIVIFNPEHNNNNDTQYVGVLRTSFTF